MGQKVALFCELVRPIIKNMKREPLPESYRMTLPELHQGIKDAKSKAEAGAVMRRFIACSGGWSDVDSETYKKLQEMFPLPPRVL